MKNIYHKRGQTPFEKGSDPFSKGFTLIEVIVSLVLVAIVGAMVVSFMGTAVTRSADPLLQVQHGNYLTQIMENITVEYESLSRKSLTDSSMSVLADLQKSIEENPNQYGAESMPFVSLFERIEFVNYVEDTDSKSDILKVTISYRGMTLTSLFTE